MMMWKIVGVSKVSVLYIYIDYAIHRLFSFDLLIILNEVTNQLSQKENIRDCIREKFCA